MPLLGPDDPPPVEIVRPGAKSDFLFVCDHAGKAIPRALGLLGLSDDELSRHIGWDIGAAAVGRLLADALGATLILQAYSRLVIDCNRSPEVLSSIATVSEHTAIPGNENITLEQAEARRREIFAPYHDRIAAELDQRARPGRKSIMIAVHSFTPVFKSVGREWHAGVLYNRDTRLAHIVLDLLRDEGDLVVGDNEPYAVSDLTDYTIPIHAERRGLPHVELEIRQDLIAEPDGQREWAARLALVLKEAAAQLA